MEKLVRDEDDNREVQEPLVVAASLDCVPNRATLTEEDIWLAGQRSARTRKSYKADIEHFMRSLGITSHDELVKADRAMVIDVAAAHGARRSASSYHHAAYGFTLLAV